jgi:hypothetical protein
MLCGSTSYNANDVRERYCVVCDRFHDDPWPRLGGMPAAGRVHILQCLCPQRHCIMAVAYELRRPLEQKAIWRTWRAHNTVAHRAAITAAIAHLQQQRGGN